MERRNVKYRLGALSHLEAEVFGQPGRRTFRLALEAGNARCFVWLEKEQMLQLGLYLKEAIDGLSPAQREQASQPREPGWDGGGAELDFKAAQLQLGYDSQSNSFYMAAQEGADDKADPNSVSYWFTLEQGERLSDEALRICAAGRPPCFLCGLPMNSEGHVCPRANGHAVFEAG